MKQRALQQARLSEEPAYAEIEMPRNSPTGFICFTVGVASIGSRAYSGVWFYGAMAATFILGAGFLSIELREFASIMRSGR